MSTNKTAPAVNIESYLINKEAVTITPKPTPYSVVLINDTDFVILRKKARSERELVVLMSENLFYFREKGIIEEITHERLSAFLKDLRDEYIELPQVNWFPRLNKDNGQNLIKVISNPTYVEMCRANVLTYIDSLYWAEKYWKENGKLFAAAHSSIKGHCSQSYRAYMLTAFEIAKKYGLGEAFYYVEMLKKSSVEIFTANTYRYSSDELEGFFQLLEEPYSFDLRRLIEYTFLDTCEQGIVRVDSEFWKMYAEYLSMQNKLYGEIREKYPRFLKTAYDVMKLNVGVIPADEDSTDQPDEISALAHTGNDYSIMIPENQKQIAEECIALNHCVGAAANRNGSRVIFMRNTQTPEQPLLTLLYGNGQITQAMGEYRRGLNDDERRFLEGWGNETGVKIAA